MLILFLSLYFARASLTLEDSNLYFSVFLFLALSWFHTGGENCELQVQFSNDNFCLVPVSRTGLSHLYPEGRAFNESN